MIFNEYQREAHRTASTKSSIVMCALGLAGESGEVADAIKKHVYHEHVLLLSKLKDELGDVLWYIAEMCTVIGITLEEVAQHNLTKLGERYPEGFTSERSINRED